MKTFDLIVIGGGAAGITASRGPAVKGWKIAMIEKDFMGGTCTNVGCMPTKALLASAHFLHKAKHADKLNLKIPQASADWTAVRERMERFVAKLRSGSEDYPKQFDNMTFYRREAKFTGPKTITVGSEVISADRIIIAAGARSFIPPIPGIDSVDYLTSTTALALPTLPNSLAILGGGVLSAEFAQIFARLGSKVTIIEQNSQILGNLDVDLANEFKTALEEEGVRVLTGFKVNRLSPAGSDIKVSFSSEDGMDDDIIASQVLVATGRKPNSDLLDLENAGVEVDSRGFITTASDFRTNVEGIWAIGDVIGGAMYTHKARHDGMLMSDHLVNHTPIDNRNRIIPFAVFTDPEIAVVGESENSAKNKGLSYTSKKLPYENIGRAGAASRTRGFIKLLAETETGQLLGAQIIGENAGDIVHTIVMAMRLKGTIRDLKDMLSIHPTYAEGLYSTAMLFKEM